MPAPEPACIGSQNPTWPMYGDVPFEMSSLKLITPVAPAKSPVPLTIGWWHLPRISVSVRSNWAVNVKVV